MSDVMLLGALRMPLPDDPAEVDLWVWHQLKGRIQEAAARIERDADQITGFEADLREERDRVARMRVEHDEEVSDLLARIAALEEIERLSAIAQENAALALKLLVARIDKLLDDPMPRLDHNWRTGQPAASQAEIDAWMARQSERRKLDWIDSSDAVIGAGDKT